MRSEIPRVPGFHSRTVSPSRQHPRESRANLSVVWMPLPEAHSASGFFVKRLDERGDCVKMYRQIAQVNMRGGASEAPQQGGHSSSLVRCSWLLLGLFFVISPARLSASGPVFSLSQSDPAWPLEAHTAFAVNPDVPLPSTISTISWFGQFNGTAPGGPVGFHLRFYAGTGTPAVALVGTFMTSYLHEAQWNGSIRYTATLNGFAVPAETHWVEIQAECPGVPQWGVSAIDDLWIASDRAVQSPTLGIEEWRDFALMQEDGASSGGAGAQAHRDAYLYAPEEIATRVLTVGPNPFVSRLNLRVCTATAIPPNATVLDVHGRIIARLSATVSGTRLWDVSWGGQTARGHDCPAGAYFVHISDGDTPSIVRRVVRLDGRR